LPREVRDSGVKKYGFHGLSYEYIVQELRRIDPARAHGRVIVAHLGNGASLAAVLQGQCLDTTMGLTPLGGLVMGTRSGDLDPGVVLFLQRERGLSVAQVDTLLNKQSGLVGLAGSTSDMKDLLARAATDPAAGLAVEVFCYQAAKHVAALATALGGLETLVFTAGIGEHAAPIRARIATRLAFLGLKLDPARNTEHAAVISTSDSPVSIRVIRTNEELMIARQAIQILTRS
jgi:acetate kinase